MKQNVVLIGMPGAGKSTIGVILAKQLSMKFIDTDLLIQMRYKMPLQEIVDMLGYLELRHIEENEILQIDADRTVIATGGSAVYSENAIRHLKENGTIVYLKCDIGELLKRIHDFATRGLAKKNEQSFDEMFVERETLYKKHAEITIDCAAKNHDGIAHEIVNALKTKI